LVKMGSLIVSTMIEKIWNMVPTGGEGATAIR
jgi:hypothetical protein